MNFVREQSVGALFAAADRFSRQTPLLEPGFSLCASDLVEAPDEAIARAGIFGHEFTSMAIDSRCGPIGAG
jgi:hypothetical protein